MMKKALSKPSKKMILIIVALLTGVSCTKSSNGPKKMILSEYQAPRQNSSPSNAKSKLVTDEFSGLLSQNLDDVIKTLNDEFNHFGLMNNYILGVDDLIQNIDAYNNILLSPAEEFLENQKVLITFLRDRSTKLSYLKARLKSEKFNRIDSEIEFGSKLVERNVTHHSLKRFDKVSDGITASKSILGRLKSELTYGEQGDQELVSLRTGVLKGEPTQQQLDYAQSLIPHFELSLEKVYKFKKSCLESDIDQYATDFAEIDKNLADVERKKERLELFIEEALYLLED